MAGSESRNDQAEGGGTLPRGPAASIAYRRRPGRADLPGVVFLGGFRSDMGGVKADHLDRFCAARAQRYLRFDYQGHGASTTPFEACTVGLWREDSLAALDRLTEGPQILVGSSMGAWLALLAALARPTRVAGLVCIAGAVDFTEALLWPRLGAGLQQALRAAGQVRIPSAYDPAGYVVTRALVEEGRDHLLLGGPIALPVPVRLLHGMADPDVPWQHSLRLAAALEDGDVVTTLIKDGDHRLSRPQDLARLAAAIDELSQSPAASSAASPAR
jgi:pimeloyl-ACP methyl ester carboxylesterase